MAAKFVPLHVHSHFSLLKALPKIPELVARAKAEGVEALALTDIGGLYGAIDFYKVCKDAGIKPIIGLDASIEGGPRLLLYAKDFAGYQNLLKLVTLSHRDDAAGRPVTRAELNAHSEGILTLEPGDDSVALHETYYLHPEDRRAWETMRAIENRGPVEEGDLGEEEDSYHFYSAKEMSARYSAAQLQKTLDIAAECNLELTLGKFIFPDFPLPPGQNADELLRALCVAGLPARGMEGRTDVMERLEYELNLIKLKGYAAYFLVVEDLIRFARERDIYTNIRGSVAGSIVTYLLRITKIDPLEYRIPFERFLNPERPSAPDIDMDFADNRRDEVIEYTRAKYGEDKVAQIGTFGTMLARGVVRDVARALGKPYGLGDRIAKLIPLGSQGFPMTLERALKENHDLAELYKTDAEVAEIIDLGRKIEGCVRHVGVHAAGVVIAPRPLVEFTPLQLDPKGDKDHGKLITQYDMYSVGEDGVGLTKFDFLGIRNLTILANAVALVQKLRGTTLDIEAIPLDDAKTYAMLTHGDTEATFQLNGAGMTRFLKELKPTTIHDINAMVALYRPGPMQFIPQYIERKHRPELIKYFDPAMEPILNQTYGILVYQDDLLIMAHDLAGYSWGDVDKFRKAVGKKIPEEMAAQKEKFIKGCVAHSKWPQKKAEAVWEWIEPFAAYGFNKAHSASYGRVAYQTAYMKANYPVEYMAAVLTAEAGDVDTVAVMVGECKRLGVPVLPPDVNESFGVFTVISSAADPSDSPSNRGRSSPGSAAPDSIRFGLYSIKNFGSGVADEILKERKAGGKFTSLGDFLSRIKTQGLNKKGLESLIMCGALDSLGERGHMLSNLELLLRYHRDAAQLHDHNSLFAATAGNNDLKLPPAPAATLKERLVWEKELLGLCVSGHPLDQYKTLITDALKKSNAPGSIRELISNILPGQTTVTAGIVETIRTIVTKGGEQMAFIKLADYDGTIEAVVFPKGYAQYKDILKPDSCVAVKGKLSNRNGELSLVAEVLKAL